MKKDKFKYLVAFLLPILFLFINLVVLKIMNPNKEVFSSDKLLIADLMSQYSGLFSYLKDVFNGNASLIYSFSKNLGGGMFGTFMYYLSSPLNLILYLFPKDQLMNGIASIILVKFGLCGLFMYIFLSNHFKTKEYFFLIFSTFYALMGYNLVYYFNFMWLDAIYLTPLVILGIDNIINKNKISLYVFSLAISIICNFYISYMLCIFCIFYFYYQIMLVHNFSSDRRKILSKLVLFLFSSLVAGLISSFVLIPGLISSFGMLRINYQYSSFKIINPLNNFLTFIYKLFPGNQIADNILSKYTPNVYFGLLPMIFVIMYFFNKKISLREKILTGIMYLMFIISFCFNIPNLLWHGFSYPNGYAFRFSFLFSFFSLLIACRSMLLYKSKLSYKFLLAILLSIVLIIVLNIVTTHREISIILGLIFSFFLVGIYLIILTISGNIVNLNKRKWLVVFLIIALASELVVNVNTSFYTTTSVNYDMSYVEFRKDVCSYVDSIKENNTRIDSEFIFGTLSSFICSNKGYSGALSTHNGNLYKFLYDTGHTVTYSTVLNRIDMPPVIHTLFGLKYFISISDNYERLNYYYKNIDSFMYRDIDGDPLEYYVYKNNLALSIGYIIKDKNVDFNYKNSFEYQNLIFKNMTGINKDVFRSYKRKKIDNLSYKYDINNDKLLYVSLKYPMPENMKDFASVYIDKNIYDLKSNSNGIFVVENGFDKKSIDVKVLLNKESYKYFDVDDDIISVYYLDKAVFEKGIDVLSHNQLDISYINKNILEGSIDVDDDNSLLFLSIPYEKGWNIIVDGKKVKYEKIYDTFIGVRLDKGKHKIKMEYKLIGLDFGILFSKIGLVMFISYHVFKRRNKYESR